MQAQVTGFFELLKQKVEELEVKVSRKIEDSTNLHSLITSLDEMHSYMVENDVAEKYSTAKDGLDEKISEGRFTYVTRRKDTYNKTIG